MNSNSEKYSNNQEIGTTGAAPNKHSVAQADESIALSDTQTRTQVQLIIGKNH
ncbi:hypothetical protein [Companilactobacillus versmoldensis]|uniref:Uncharacterized protein n=1 Tax=Companilactobacillus versmoldensis DSM 14857 = KCTC 3814 TaxID=1423815 RepID=A0A0R1SDT1_9LACO|nr:hypothetical protein [Companilactobacillus versmoldensis]KRL67485.1 hypothetical protein FC27_GL001801 [Companilactobacillus versmoldensis DSM 14857 = KCTC 3814]